MTTPEQQASVRYIVDDVVAAIAFYANHFGFTVHTNAAPAFADVTRGPLRLLLSGPASSGARARSDGAQPVSGGWNRILLEVDDLDAELDRLKTGGLSIRDTVISGPGGRQILVTDPAGNPIELFEARNQPGGRQAVVGTKAESA